MLLTRVESAKSAKFRLLPKLNNLLLALEPAKKVLEKWDLSDEGRQSWEVRIDDTICQIVGCLYIVAARMRIYESSEIAGIFEELADRAARSEPDNLEGVYGVLEDLKALSF